MPASVLLISSDADQRRSVSQVLHGPAYAVALATDLGEALALTGGHDLLILDATGAPETVLEICRQTRTDPILMSMPLLVIGQTDDVEERIQFLEAGADDVVGRPYDGRELEARVEALVARFQRTLGLDEVVGEAAAAAVERRTVAVFAPKGGVGTTTIAVNVAAAIAASRPEQVLLIDLDLQFGGVSIHLDLSPRQTIIDLSRDDAGLRDPEQFRSYATRHESGLHVLAGPASPEQTELLSHEQLVQLLDTAASAYESIVVDAGSTLDERAMTILDWADAVILPFHPEIPALKAVHSLLDYLNTTGEVVAKSVFVLNNAFARQALRMRDIEQALGTKVATELPYDAMAYLNAANEGIPVVIGAPRSPAARTLHDLATTVFAETVAASEPPTAQRGGFGGFLRRPGRR